MSLFSLSIFWGAHILNFAREKKNSVREDYNFRGVRKINSAKIIRTKINGTKLFFLSEPSIQFFFFFCCLRKLLSKRNSERIKDNKISPE